MVEAELLWQNLNSAEKFLFLCSTQSQQRWQDLNPTSLLCCSHMLTLGKCEYPSLFHQCHQGRNREEERVSLSYPTTRKTPKLMGRSAHGSVKGWVFWAHQVMNGKWNPALFCDRTLFSHTLIITVCSTESSQAAAAVFLALPAFDTTALEGTQSLPAMPLLVAMWVVCEGRLTCATINLHNNNDISCLFKAHL